MKSTFRIHPPRERHQLGDGVPGPQEQPHAQATPERIAELAARARRGLPLFPDRRGH